MSREEKLDDDLMLAVDVPIADIPVIDFAPFLAGSPSDRARVAAEIREACERIGFFNLVGHGVAVDLRTAMFDQSAAFYHQPVEQRQLAAPPPGSFRGWIGAPPSADGAHRSRLFEQYRIQSEWGPVPGLEPELNLHYDQRNVWPADMPEFRAVATRYYAAVLALARSLAHAFAIGLGVTEGRFDRYFDKPLAQMTLLHYQPLPPESGAELSNTVAHTDDGAFTILAQGEVGGLEVRRRDGSWIAVPPIDGAYTINVGDMLMWWSNGRFLSNLHRVKNRAGRERFSVPFFMNPSGDTVVAPLPELVAPFAEPAFPPVHVARHMARYYVAKGA